MKDTPKEITQKQLIRAMKASNGENSDIRYAFLLGAGASIASGIPSGGDLAKKWMEELEADIDEDTLDKWKKDIGYDANKPVGEYYTRIYPKRFEVNPSEGFEKLQDYMEKAKPSVGYAFLAQFLANTQNRIVITTNFDTMTEDALFGFTKTRPLVLGHELLSSYLKSSAPARPTIIKVHRDMMLEPYSKENETEKLAKTWQKALQPILKNHGLVVLGYGGNDDSLMNYLKDIKDRKPIYWCYLPTYGIPDKAKALLTGDDFIVPIKGFDEFMLLLNDAMGYDALVSEDNIAESKIVKDAIAYATIHRKQLEKLMQSEQTPEEKEATKKLLPSWWDYQLKVNDTDDVKEKDKIFQEGLKAHPASHELMGNYANFLHDIRKEYDKAESYYIKALELDPNDADYNGNYASFLHDIRKEYDKAESYYIKALELDPNSAIKNGNYAQFLLANGEKEKAEAYINKAFENHTTENDLTVELWFYRLAHYPEYFEKAQKELDRLLADGHRSIGWNFEDNILRAEKDGFDDIAMLRTYADRISKE